AWLWVKQGEIPSSLPDAISAYNVTSGHLGEEATDFHAVPEIAAAVHSFVMSREAVPGIYVYFDIGAGTVDGVAFNFLNDDGERRINFYSGKVAPLGISALAAFLGAKPSGEIDQKRLEEILRRGQRHAVDHFATDIRNLVGYVVMT